VFLITTKTGHSIIHEKRFLNWPRTGAKLSLNYYPCVKTACQCAMSQIISSVGSSVRFWEIERGEKRRWLGCIINSLLQLHLLSDLKKLYWISKGFLITPFSGHLFSEAGESDCNLSVFSSKTNWTAHVPQLHIQISIGNCDVIRMSAWRYPTPDVWKLAISKRIWPVSHSKGTAEQYLDSLRKFFYRLWSDALRLFLSTSISFVFSYGV
jgi:hypothetical protein